MSKLRTGRKPASLELEGQLRRFMAGGRSHVRVAGVRWEYIACGEGDEGLLLLPGAPGKAGASFAYAAAFQHAYRVVAPSYSPELRTVDDFLKGIDTILAAEKLDRVSVIGGSYSGLLAQSFVRHSPTSVHRLVLSDTGVPRRARARQYRRYLRLLYLLPSRTVAALWRLGGYLYVRQMKGPDKAFWRRYFGKLQETVTKADCISRLRVWIDFDQTARFHPRDLKNWPGCVLIIEAEHDAIFGDKERQALCRLYPNAQTHLILSGGHAASLDKREEYIATITRFLLVVPSTEIAS